MRGIVAEMFDLYGGGRGLFSPGGEYSGRPPRSVLALAPGEIPTTSLYLKGRIEKRFGVSVHYVDGLRTSPKRFRVDNDAWIVIVRYAPPKWLHWLERQRQKLAGVVYLLDDDIPSAVGAIELPFMYALKTTWRYARTRRLLERLCSEVWVSTPELAGRYPSATPKLWEPHYLEPPFSTRRPVVYFYHGTWAHRREIEWLAPIVRRVQESVPNACFEIMGTDQVRRLYRGIPRVRIVHPMPWSDYLAYAGTIQYHLGLAPCFDTFFNRARSHNKIFDITRLGAAGIYSNSVPYADKIVHGHTGLLCENSADSWVTAITSLLQDQDMRTAMYQEALRWCKSLPH